VSGPLFCSGFRKALKSYLLPHLFSCTIRVEHFNIYNYDIRILTVAKCLQIVLCLVVQSVLTTATSVARVKFVFPAQLGAMVLDIVLMAVTNLPGVPPAVSS